MGRFIARIVAAGVCLALCAPGIAVAQQPVKIGMLVPLTGVFSRNGREAVDGTRLYLDEIGWKVAGRTIELLVDQFQNVVQPQYVRKVERAGTTLVNTPIKTYPNFSQFGPWTPEEFMKYPAWTEFKGKMTDCSKVLGK